MKHQGDCLYIACEDLKLNWHIDQVLEFDQLWNRGHSLEFIADYLECDMDEAALLLLCRRQNNKTKLRNRGIKIQNKFKNMYPSKIKETYETLKKQGEEYLVLEHSDFFWLGREIQKFEKLWNDDYSVHQISKVFKRALDEIVILIIDRARKGYIQPRKYGVYCKKNQESSAA